MWATARFVHDRKKNKAAAVKGEPNDGSTHDLEQGSATQEGGLSPMIQTARGDMGHSVSPDYPVSSMTPSPQASRASPEQQEHTMQNVATREEQSSDDISYQAYRPQAHTYEQTEFADGLIATGGVRDHLNVDGQRNGGAAPSYGFTAVQPQVSEPTSYDTNWTGAAPVPPINQPPADVVELDSSQRAQNRNPEGVELP